MTEESRADLFSKAEAQNAAAFSCAREAFEAVFAAFCKVEEACGAPSATDFAALVHRKISCAGDRWLAASKSAESDAQEAARRDLSRFLASAEKGKPEGSYRGAVLGALCSSLRSAAQEAGAGAECSPAEMREEAVYLRGLADQAKEAAADVGRLGDLIDNAEGAVRSMGEMSAAVAEEWREQIEDVKAMVLQRLKDGSTKMGGLLAYAEQGLKDYESEVAAQRSHRRSILRSVVADVLSDDEADCDADAIAEDLAADGAPTAEGRGGERGGERGASDETPRRRRRTMDDERPASDPKRSKRRSTVAFASSPGSEGEAGEGPKKLLLAEERGQKAMKVERRRKRMQQKKLAVLLEKREQENRRRRQAVKCASEKIRLKNAAAKHAPGGAAPRTRTGTGP